MTGRLVSADRYFAFSDGDEDLARDVTLWLSELDRHVDRKYCRHPGQGFVQVMETMWNDKGVCRLLLMLADSEGKPQVAHGKIVYDWVVTPIEPPESLKAIAV